MTQPNVTDYLNPESKSLTNLLSKLKVLRQWNLWLKQCLPEETLLTTHCQIVGLDGTSLIVIANNPHWVTRFRFHIPNLLKKLQQYSELSSIRSICCKVRPAQYPMSVKKNKQAKLCLSVENSKMLKEAALKLQDVKLRAVLEKIAENVDSSSEK